MVRDDDAPNLAELKLDYAVLLAGAELLEDGAGFLVEILLHTIEEIR